MTAASTITFSVLAGLLVAALFKRRLGLGGGRTLQPPQAHRGWGDQVGQRAIGRDLIGPTVLHEVLGQLALGESLGPVNRARDVHTPAVALSAGVDLGPQTFLPRSSR